jgi:formylglycine-generating enzyme required for sulfatase activity
MIEDLFLRQAAALQANLRTLESQSDTLSDLADMKELRHYKARLADFIDAHAATGHLPSNPFWVVELRLAALSQFFAAADQRFRRLHTWRQDWLKSVPAVTLADLHAASAELDALVAETPTLQQGLRAMLEPLDWDTSAASPDLHPELLACAQALSGLTAPEPAKRRHELHAFAHAQGPLARQVSQHFGAIAARIQELIAIHGQHVAAVADAEQAVERHDFRTAQQCLNSLVKGGFTDLNEQAVEVKIRKLEAIFKRFSDGKKSLDQRLKTGEYQAVEAEIGQLRQLITKPDSELGRDGLELLREMESAIAQQAKAARQDKKKQRIVAGSVFAALIVLIVLCSAVQKKQAAEARAKAAEARAKAAEAAEAYERSSGSRAGEQKIFEIAPGVSMTFCWCPAGEFVMGSPASEEDRDDDENQVKVTLRKGFWMAKTEVTQAQWQAVMGANPSRFKGANLPVETVSWNDAQDFLKKLNARLGSEDGGIMALPTEAQWEYAARAGQSGAYSGGALDQVAWWDDNSGGTTHPVGTKRANAWGLHDMSGNVWEWCAGWYHEDLPGGVDPRGPTSGTGRVDRGGSWNYDATGCRVAFRGNGDPTGSNNGIGFRVARSSVP